MCWHACVYFCWWKENHEIRTTPGVCTKQCYNFCLLSAFLFTSLRYDRLYRFLACWFDVILYTIPRNLCKFIQNIECTVNTNCIWSQQRERELFFFCIVVTSRTVCYPINLKRKLNDIRKRVKKEYISCKTFKKINYLWLEK